MQTQCFFDPRRKVATCLHMFAVHCSLAVYFEAWFVWRISFYETLIYNTLKFIPFVFFIGKLLWFSSQHCSTLWSKCDLWWETNSGVAEFMSALAVFGSVKNSNVPEKMQRKTFFFWHCNLNEWFYCPALWILVSANQTCWKFFSKDLKRESRHGQSAFHGWEQSGDEFGGRVFFWKHNKF